jgi:DNA-binding LacI/PurR family transcriptional regulator
MSSDANARPPTRPPTMADIAEHLGVSRQLVSIVMRDVPGASEETRKRVKAAAQELGFSAHVGARSLRRTQSRDLGVIFAPAHVNEYEIVEAIYPAGAELGYDVVLSAQTATRGTRQAVEELLGHRCAALIVIGSDLHHGDMRKLTERSPVPVVDVGYGRLNGFYDVVRSSGDRGISDMVDHLVRLGHREIAYVNPASMPPAVLRQRGYVRAMNRHGLEADSIAISGDYTVGGYFEEAGAAGARMLLERGALPTAVVVPNDGAAVGLLQALTRAGVRVPDDVSVTGFDDAPPARLSAVDLTTVRQDPRLMGRAAVEAAVRRIADVGLGPEETVVPTSLVVRTSTAPPRPER